MSTTSASQVRRYGWPLLLAVVIALMWVGSDRTPNSGTSDDRLYALADDLKCLQCVGESVGNSQAPIAIKMRSEISDQLEQGRTDDEVFSYFVERYGQRVLLNPPASGVSGLVWILPVVATILATAGLAAAFMKWRGERMGAASEPSSKDRAVVDAERAHER